jgi:1,4-alpha-glucan branching enzyme
VLSCCKIRRPHYTEKVRFLLLAAFIVACSASVADEASTDATAKPSKAVGMGAVVGAAGSTAFRVWAPNATRVYVRGDFNAWAEPGIALAKEASGHYSGDVAKAKPGHAYEYVMDTPNGRIHRADPRSKRVEETDGTFGNSVIVDPNAYAWRTSNYRTPAWNEQVLYELHIGTFADGSGPGTGTWKTATTKLAHLQSLGVNVIEVMPPSEFQGGYSWGYNPSFLFATENAYGTPDDMKRFVDEAHARGIGIVVDIVHNHYGPDLGRSLWQFDGASFGRGGIYFYTDARFETGFGPRPDYGRAEVRDFVVDNAMLWLEEYRVDGLRWDSTVNMRRFANAEGRGDIGDGWELLKRVNDTVDKKQPWKMMIAEDLQNDTFITKPTNQGGAGFDAQWEPEFFYPMKDVLTGPSDEGRDMNRVVHALTHGYNGSALQRLIFTENHDEAAPQNGGKKRLSEEICPGLTASCRVFAQRRAMLGLSVLLTAPGIPMLFQGQEFADNTPFPFSRGVGIDWQKKDLCPGLVTMTKDLIALRRNLGGSSKGLMGNNLNVFHVNSADKLVAYHRFDGGGAGDDVVVLANFSNRAFPSYEIGLPRSGTWRVRFNGDAKVYSPSFSDTPIADATAEATPKDGLRYKGNVGVGPYSVIVLSQ